MDTLAYIDWLLSVNQDVVKRPAHNLPTVGFGLAEEVLELQEALETEAAVKELGDCTAYYSLLCVCLGYSPQEVAKNLTNVTVALASSAELLKYLGTMKRVFRGDENVGSADVEAAAFQLLMWGYQAVAVSLPAVLAVNKQKLEDRLARTNTFHGKGDNR